MAYSDHAPLMGPGSPPRIINGPPPSQLPHPAYGPRPMPPPSPNFSPRYPNHTASFSSTIAPPVVSHDLRAPPSNHSRAGSSMSIMSMLGSEPERPHQQSQPRQLPTNHLPSTSTTSMSLGAVMSPPQNPVKTNPAEYTYKPRSQTPDRMAYPGQFGGATRPYRSSSGTMMQRPHPFDDLNGSQSAKPPFSRLNETMPPVPDTRFMERKPASAEQSRRSSINAILGPQDIVPPPVSQMSRPASNMPFDRYGRVEPDRSDPIGNGLYSAHTANGQLPGVQAGNSIPQNGHSNPYDTRPPGFGAPAVQPASAPKAVDGPSSYNGRGNIQPDSPESRRRTLFANLTANNANHQHGQQNPYSQEQPSMGSQIMSRQDSSRSQNDPFADRGTRRFSPFATGAASQAFSNTSAPLDDRNWKGSDESSQHRTILGLAADSKRGRYSPLPQAVHGAQAQTPTPDGGTQDEHGRVFSGLGSGIMNNSSTVPAGPVSLSASPFKRDEGIARLSEDNLMKISRSTPGTSKRPRKMKDEADDNEDTKRVMTNGRGKRSKYSHYNLNGEELTNALAYPRKNTPSALDFGRPSATTATTNNNSLNRNVAPSSTPAAPLPLTVFKPRTTIKINSIIRDAARKPRKHLGFFLYTPTISALLNANTITPKREVQIEPNVHPVFDVPEHTNCTYTIRVSRTWLRKAEREAICSTRALWGSGIYTDDTDPVAAAIHSGFIKGSFPDHVDAELLEKVYNLQNPKIDGGSDHLPPSPVEPPVGKDCHITLVVLPALDTYSSSVRYGIRSRRWPEERGQASHDGVSFMVLSTRWVNEGSQRGKRRRGDVVRRND